MKTRSGLLGLTFATALAMTSANAAGPASGGYKDEPVPPPPTWTGFYLGVNTGYAWNNTDSDILYFAGPTLANRGAGFESSGPFLGAQIGYNWQFGQFVLGFETDIQAGGAIRDKFSQVSAPGNLIAGLLPQGEETVNYFGTVRGRIGYAAGGALIYATGGLAYGEVRERVAVLTPGGVVAATFATDQTDTGFAVGGGVEYQITPSFSVKAEYQYIDLGNNRLVGTAPAFGPGIATSTNSIDTNFNTVRLGLNFRLGGNPVPLK